jgi:hypothetical protein
MGIEYRTNHTTPMNDGYSEILREASEYFASQRIHMVGNGFDEILSENALFDTYVEKLCAGLSADEAVQMSQLMENARMQIMQEASISGIQPIASLSMPTVRKMWVKVALKNALPTEAVKAPKFAISYMEPYLLNHDGSKVQLPAALRDPNNTQAQRRALSTSPVTLPANGFDLLGPVGASVVGGDTIDPVFFVQYVNIQKGTDASGNPIIEQVRVDLPLDIRNNVSGTVSTADGTVSDVLFAVVDRNAGVFNATSLNGKVKSVIINGFLSSENNANQQSVSFDIRTKDITIGTGAHINAPLPIEWLQDTMAMYQIDGALEVVDIMANVVAQKLEQQIRQFLEDSFVRSGLPYKGTFDVRPSSHYTGSPKDWREELKTVIDHYAIRMKNDSAFSNGKFVIMGNPLDTNLITNVDWVFNSVAEDRGGVEVEFNLGAYSAANRYEIVSTPNIPQGVLRMIFIPSSPKQMTYKYYPYTFNVEKGYIDPNRPNVPSIMMTKRQTIEELTPLAAEIAILNNNGQLPS